MSKDLMVSAHLVSLLNSSIWRIVIEDYLDPAVASLEDKALSLDGTPDDLRQAQGARIVRDLFLSALQNDANTQADS